MNIAQQFNNLDGKEVTIRQLLNLRKKAVENCAIHTLSKIDKALKLASSNKFILKIKSKDEEPLLGIDKAPEDYEPEMSLDGKKSPYEVVTELIVDTIKQHPNKLVFEKTWNEKTIKGLLLSGSTKKPYRGVNGFLFNFVLPILKGKTFKNRYFFTIKHARKLGGKLKKDAVPYPVVFYSIGYHYKNDKVDIKAYNEKKFTELVEKNINKIDWILSHSKKNPNKELSKIIKEFVEYNSFPIPQQYTVYNGEDITGIDWKKFEKNAEVENYEQLDFKPIEIAEEIVKNYSDKPKITHSGDSAFYLPGKDVVNMPPKGSFKTETGYYATLFHELIHSTGAKKRLNRTFEGTFGSEKYAFEELIAEIGAAFISAETGILNHHIKNTAAYIKGWNKRLIDKMEDDPQFIFKASSKAQKAADYILKVDKNGIPKYRKVLLKDNSKKKVESEKVKIDYSKPDTYSNDLNLETLRNSYYWISFNPDKRAKNEYDGWKEKLSSEYKDLKNLAEENKYPIESLDNEFSKYHKGLLNRKLKVISNRSNMASSAITGGGKFPVEKQRRIHNRQHDLEGDYFKYTEKGIRKIKSKIYGSSSIKSGEKDTILKLNEKLDSLIKLNELQKEFNKNYQGKKSTKEEKELFFSENDIVSLFKKGFTNSGTGLVKSSIKDAINGGKLVVNLYLTRNINELKKRIKGEEIRDNFLNELKDEYEYPDVTIVLNKEANRIQLIYDGKPEQEIITKLKKNGFRWSPRYKAWQRQLNFNGINAAKRVIGHDFKKKSESKKEEKQLELFGVDNYIQTELLTVNNPFKKLKLIEVKKEVKDILNTFISKKFKNIYLDKYIIVTKKTNGKVIFGRKNERFNKTLATAILYLPHLITYGKIIKETTPKKSHINKFKARKIITLESKIKIENKTEYFTLTLIENNKGILHYYITGSNIKKSVSNRKSTLKRENSKDKNQSVVATKNELSNKNNTKNKPKQGLSGKNIENNDLFQLAADKNISSKAPNTFRLNGEIGKFMQDLQRYRMSIVLTGDPHAGKSEFAKQLLNAFISKEMTAVLWDLEQGGLISKDTKQSIDRNITKANQNKLFVAGEAPEGFESIKKYANDFDVVMIDSFQKLAIPSSKFDELRIEYPNTIWIVIFQQNSQGGTRGGVMADYDTPIKIKVHKVDDTFKNNYAELQKNRGNIVGLKYNVYSKKLIQEETNNQNQND